MFFLGWTPVAFIAIFANLKQYTKKENMNFVDSSEKTLLKDYEFSWGVTMADLNLNERQDIIISQNYVDLPFQKIFRLPGRILLQNEDRTYASVEKYAGAENRKYERSAVLADFNGDGYLDQIRANLSGKSRAFISKGGDNKYLRVKIPSNAKMLGSKVAVELDDGSILYDWHISGEGLCSDQEHVLTFGPGKTSKPKKVQVFTPGGETLTKAVETQNSTVSF